ncbi:uncharacterized protein TRIADDRAFT_25783 [Trichoplax adhaerens]|uniref:T-complex protein 1 subunit theta n=1 Tax=Trichoplax adhaerens TaxID=10228 RepID=B3RYD2_TRIAD|nr:hypothetical protein TRIADDRAFT_25783 [Trichoplax adhaerens]EDV24579.1 hypothetical protein TRIADDRAFT_25783 [Trichoplax adhaerens]|eukprot:XP_002112469.1 hypothetical protein TRIADDRAFT_25783 [Trichoplax adhaerens]
MALHIPRGMLQTMMKDGAKHFSGFDEAILRNLNAAKELARMTRTSYGPNGMNKMIINHIEKLFVSNDAATMIKEMEVQHPAAKMLVYSLQMQEQEIGDGTNFVIIFAGALLELAEDLLRMGLSPTEIIEGYEMACKKAIEILPDLVCGKVSNLRDESDVGNAIRTSVASKQYGYEGFLSDLIAKACISTVGASDRVLFNVDNVRVAKILGSGVLRSSVLRGMVFRRGIEGKGEKLKNAKVVVYSCPVDISQTETKGTVLLKSADELLEFSKGEETILEAQIQAIANTGCNIVVSGGKVGEMALHFLNKFKIMVVRIPSKFDLRRLCRTVGATALPKIMPPTADECGSCDRVYLTEIGDNTVTVFDQSSDSVVSTIVIRGSSDNIMDDVERSIDDGVNTYKALTKDPRLVPGAGATEIELAKEISSYSETCPGLAQYAIKKFAQALEALPRALAENSGVNANEVISNLYAAHQTGDKASGFDIETGKADVKNATECGIVDLYLVKHWGLRFATDAAATVLRVDQIFMSKPAGGPKPPEAKDRDDD